MYVRMYVDDIVYLDLCVYLRIDNATCIVLCMQPSVYNVITEHTVHTYVLPLDLF